VIDDEDGQAFHPERVGLVVGQRLEGGRGDDGRRNAGSLEGDGVVETPRRA
jgi:hypothetical protein